MPPSKYSVDVQINFPTGLLLAMKEKMNKEKFITLK